MIINYSDEKVIKNEKSIFLAGPTPRSAEVKTWRKEACAKIEKLGFDGVVYVPEYSSHKPLEEYLNQVEWERDALSNASVIVFWIPRSLPDMPAFTTNVEFGYWIHTGKVIYGRPDDSEKNRYLDWLYEKDMNIKPFNNIDDLLANAVEMANKIGVNELNKVMPIEERKVMQ